MGSRDSTGGHQLIRFRLCPVLAPQPAGLRLSAFRSVGEAGFMSGLEIFGAFRLSGPEGDEGDHGDEEYEGREGAAKV